MNRTTTTVAALLVAAIASGGAAPVLAQDQSTSVREIHLRGSGGPAFEMHRSGPRERMMRRGGGRNVLALVCSERGTDRLEHALLTIEQRTDPTAEQQASFDAFREAALSAQADFAAACGDARPAGQRAADADVLERMKTGIALQQARLDAMNEVLPAFEAFYLSLTDEQKAGLQPRPRGEGRFGLDRRGRGGPWIETPAPEAAQPEQQG